jgi:hypothetical protein
MVGLGSIMKIAGLGVAVGLGYVLLKNAGGIGSAIGSSVGTGLSQGFQGLTDSFAGAFDIFGRDNGGTGVNTGRDSNNDGVIDGSEGGIRDPIPTTIIGESQAYSGITGYRQGEDGVTHIERLPEWQPFGAFIDQNNITAEFAEKYINQPSAQSNQLDVSNAFSYISSQSYIDRLEKNNAIKNNADNTNYNYGGYGSAYNQQTALASAIADSASKYPEWYA